MGTGPVILLGQVMPCPWCGEPNCAANSIGSPDAVPQPGDASLCAYCGEWSIFEATSMRRPTAQEVAELAADANCQAAVAHYRAKGPMPGRIRRTS